MTIPAFGGVVFASTMDNWQSLDQIQNRSGVYIKRDGMFLLLSGQQGIANRTIGIVGTSADRYPSMRANDQLVFVGHEPRILSLSPRGFYTTNTGHFGLHGSGGYGVVYSGRNFHYVNDQRVRHGTFDNPHSNYFRSVMTMGGRTNHYMVSNTRGSVITLSGWQGTNEIRQDFVVNRRVYTPTLIDTSIRRTPNGYFYLDINTSLQEGSKIAIATPRNSTHNPAHLTHGTLVITGDLSIVQVGNAAQQASMPPVTPEPAPAVPEPSPEPTLFPDNIPDESILGHTRILFQIGNLTYTVNEVPRQGDAAPFIADDRTMVPLRTVAEALGATDLNFDAGVVSFSLNNRIITMTVEQTLPNNMGTPVIVAGRTFVPLRYITEEMGVSVVWNSDAYTALVIIRHINYDLFSPEVARIVQAHGIQNFMPSMDVAVDLLRGQWFKVQGNDPDALDILPDRTFLQLIHHNERSWVVFGNGAWTANESHAILIGCSIENSWILQFQRNEQDEVSYLHCLVTGAVYSRQNPHSY